MNSSREMLFLCNNNNSPSCSSSTSEETPSESTNGDETVSTASNPAISDYFTQLAQLQLLNPFLCHTSFYQNFFHHLSQLEHNSAETTNNERKENSSSAVRKRVHSRQSTDEIPKKKPQRRHLSDQETSSPVSGMFIKEASAVASQETLQAEADLLDDTAAYVHITEESRRLVAAIPNIIGDCICFLCKVKYDDVFKLAQHRCPRIAHEEYRCPECDKMFSCPANLASHRRWHKPRPAECLQCGGCSTVFHSKKMLRSHASHCSPKLTHLAFT